MKKIIGIITAISLALSGYGVFTIYGRQGISAWAIIWGVVFGVAAILLVLSYIWTGKSDTDAAKETAASIENLAKQTAANLDSLAEKKAIALTDLAKKAADKIIEVAKNKESSAKQNAS